MLPELNNIIIDYYLDNYTWKSLIKRISINNYEYERKNIINELCYLRNIIVSKFYENKFNMWRNQWCLKRQNLFSFTKNDMITYIYNLSDQYIITWPIINNWNCNVISKIIIKINKKINISAIFDKGNISNICTCKIVIDNNVEDVEWKGYDFIFKDSHILYSLNIPNIKGNDRFKSALIEALPVLIS